MGEQRIIRWTPFHLKASRMEMTDPRLVIGIAARNENMVAHHQRRGFPPPPYFVLQLCDRHSTALSIDLQQPAAIARPRVKPICIDEAVFRRECGILHR